MNNSKWSWKKQLKVPTRKLDKQSLLRFGQDPLWLHFIALGTPLEYFLKICCIVWEKDILSDDEEKPEKVHTEDAGLVTSVHVLILDVYSWCFLLPFTSGLVKRVTYAVEKNRFKTGSLMMLSKLEGNFLM